MRVIESNFIFLNIKEIIKNPKTYLTVIIFNRYFIYKIYNIFIVIYIFINYLLQFILSIQYFSNNLS
jgi:hypothetical protein